MKIRLSDGREQLWQWDTGVRVVMDEQCDCVQYSAQHLGATVDVDVDTEGGVWSAMVPDALLQISGTLTCYAVRRVDGGSITAGNAAIQVQKRPKPYGYTYTPAEVRTWDELRALIQTGAGGDWAVNDPAAAGYIANRPGGYYGEPVTVDEEIYSGEIKQAGAEMLVDWLLVAGQTYKVTIGEVTKSYTAFADTYSGVSGVTIGDGTIEDAADDPDMFALFTTEIDAGKVALLACTEEDVGKTIRITQFGTAREVHKIPAEFLDIPPAEQVPQVVTVRLVERDGKQYGSMTFDEVLTAQRGGKEVRLLDNDGHYYQFTGVYNTDEDICFHSFRLRTLWIAIMERSGLIEIFDHSIGQQELTYSVSSGRATISDSATLSETIYSTATRIRLTIGLKLATKTAGTYVQLVLGDQSIPMCKHEDMGNDTVTVSMEMERTETSATSYFVTARLLNADGTPHASGFFWQSSATITDEHVQVISGSADKFFATESKSVLYTR